MARQFTTPHIKASQIATAAAYTLVRFRGAVDLATRLGVLSEQLRTAFEKIDLAEKPNPNDILILQAFERAPGECPAIRRRRGRATTRFFLWEPSDDDLDAAIERLRPLLDAIVHDPLS